MDRDAVLQDLIDLEAAYGRAAGSGFLDRPDIQQADIPQQTKPLTFVVQQRRNIRVSRIQ